MPQVIGAAVAWAVTGIQVAAASVGLTTTVAGSAALGTAATAVLNAAAYAGVSAGLTALTAPKVGGRTGSPEAWKSEANPPLPFPIGRIGTGGYVVYRNTYGPDNRYQGIVTVVGAAGPINAWSTFYMDDVARSQTGERINHPKYNNWAWRQTRLGLQPDTALTSPVGIEGGGAGLPGWGVNHKLSAKACEMLTLRQDTDIKYFSTGEPRAIRVIQGLLAWDPRLDSTYPGGLGSCRLDDPSTWVYSTNGGIHALKWALGLRENGVLVGGIGASLRAVDVAAFVHVANVADINGWTIGGVPTSADDKYQVIAAMLQAAGAVYVRQNGRISCISRGTPRTSLLTVTKKDLAGPIRLTTGASRIGRINTIIPRCVQEDQKWALTQLGAVSHEDYRAEDGGAVRPRGLDYPYVTDAEQCAQLAALDVAKSREGIVGSMPMKPYMRVLKPGDGFTINEPDFALANLQVVCERRHVDTASSIVTIEFSSDTPGAIEWALGQAASPPPTPSLSVPDVTTFPEPTDGSWVAVAGAGQPSIVITGATDNAQTQDVVFEYREVGDEDWLTWDIATGTATRTEVTGLEAETTYETAVSYRSIWGVTGARLVLEPVTTGISTATISEDTEAVGGRPAPVILDEIDTGAEARTELAKANMAAAFGRMKAAKLADRYRFDEKGEWLGPIIRRETIERQDAIGAVLTDIEAFGVRLETAEGDIAGQALDIVEIEVALDGKASVATANALDLRLDGAELDIIATAEELADLQIEVDGKASVTTADALDLRLDAAEIDIDLQSTQITTLQGDVAGKASITAADALDARLDTAEGTIAGHTLDITAIELDVAGKAAISTTNALDARLDTAEGTITGHTADITAIELDVAGKVSITDFETLEAEVGDHSATLTTYGSALADLEGYAAVTYGFDINVDGRVTGMKTVATGTDTTLSFMLDALLVYDPDSDDDVPFLEATADGVKIGGDLVVTASMVANTVSKAAGASASAQAPSASPTFAWGDWVDGASVTLSVTGAPMVYIGDIYFSDGYSGSETISPFFNMQIMKGATVLKDIFVGGITVYSGSGSTYSYAGGQTLFSFDAPTAGSQTVKVRFRQWRQDIDVVRPTVYSSVYVQELKR